MELRLMPDSYAVSRMPAVGGIPTWAMHGDFWSIIRTPDELSLVCAEGLLPPGLQHEAGWRLLQVAGPLDFGMVGVLASLLVPLATARVSVFTLSTFDTDYLLVKAVRLDDAIAALRAAGHSIQESQGRTTVRP